MNLYVYRSLLIFGPWATCVAMDRFCHKIGIHPGPWRWKWSVITFGVGSLIALWFMQHFNPHFFDMPR